MINMFLTKKEEQMCDGEFGETVRKSMDILVALGDIYGASKLVDITSAQVSGVSYKTIGDAGLEYLQDLASDDKGVASVNSSLNPPGTDLDNWKALGFPKEFSVKQNQIVEAYGKTHIYMIGMDDNPQPKHIEVIIKNVKHDNIFSGGKRHYEIVKPFLPADAVWIEIKAPINAVLTEYSRSRKAK